MAYIQLSTLGKGGRFLSEKNLNFYLVRHSSRERRVLRSSTTSSQRWEFTVWSPLLHRGNLACAPSFVYSSVKHRASNQIPNYVRLLRTADPGDESSPPSRCLHLGSIGAVLPIPAQSFSQSWQVGNVGKEALRPPLFQVYGHKVCTDTKTEN